MWEVSFAKVMFSLIGLLAISILGCGGDTEDTVEEIEEDKVPVPIGMVLIPAGLFEMGSDADHANIDEQPVHTVQVDAFYMDKREVTVRAYRHFVEETGHRTPDWEQIAIYSPTDDHPIVLVSWHDAMAYAKWAGKRLPTEAEWEKAARGGSVAQIYPWGDTAPAAAAKVPCNFADKNLTHYWWADKKVDDGYVYTAPVGRYLANRYGLYEMAGNVSEWCLDEYDSSFYAISPDTNPILGTDTVVELSGNFASVQSPRVLRGGSWLVNALGVRNAVRATLNPTGMASSVGFRCAKDLDVLK